MGKKLLDRLPKYQVGSHLRRCQAMLDACITDPNDREGIDFCTGECPYANCVLFEGARVMEVKLLKSQGMNTKDIAEQFKLTPATIRSNLKKCIK